MAFDAIIVLWPIHRSISQSDQTVLENVSDEFPSLGTHTHTHTPNMALSSIQWRPIFRLESNDLSHPKVFMLGMAEVSI